MVSLWIMFTIVVMIMVLYNILSSCREGFVTKEYDDITALNRIPRTSCTHLLFQKGWLSPNTKKDRKRLTIASDMQIARIPQQQLESYIYPNIEACVLLDSIAGLYINNFGQNTIDSSTCTIKGKTADGDLVFYGLDKIDSTSEIEPKGCMLDFNKIGKNGVLKLFDDLYKIKHQPYERERNDYQRLLDGGAPTKP